MAHSSQPINARRGLLMAALQMSVVSLGAASAQSAAFAASTPKVSASASASATQGKALIKLTEAKLKAAKAITFSSKTSFIGLGAEAPAPTTATVAWQRPGQFAGSIIVNGKETGKVVSTADGGYVYDAVSDQYRKTDKGDTLELTLMTTVQASMSVLPSMVGMSFPMVTQMLTQKHPFLMELPPNAKTAVQIRSYPGQLNGVAVNHITQAITGAMSATFHLYTDRKTNLPVRYAILAKNSGKETGIQIDFSDFKTESAPLPESTFQYTIPTTAKLFTPPAQTETQEQPILPAGAVAPDFAVQDVTGKTAHLADFSGKVVVLDFWSTWCGPCQASLPATDKLAKKYKGKNVVFLPVCSWDDKSAFTPWVKQRKNWTMKFYFDPAGRGAKNIASGLYKVSGIPTQFVIGKDGKVAVGFVGYDGAEGEKKLSNAIDKALAGS
ncbi:MAG: redoxin domain-containing protein [Capsulimonas sp.]|uniref:redoxin domain-containing protein n=1 Tax=Capsulimonas sp. TaxID=2494211 RepID=UPI0032659C35